MITLLTEWLYVAAQMPHGTEAQQNILRAAQRAGRVGLGARGAGAGRAAAGGGGCAGGPRGAEADCAAEQAHFRRRAPREQSGAGPRAAGARCPLAQPLYPDTDA